jgi:hypothetical protein
MVTLIATAIITTAIIVMAMDILMDITTLAATGMTIIMDQGMDSVIGDEIIGQGGRTIYVSQPCP